MSNLTTPLFANFSEVGDAPSTTGTPYSISVGDTFTGTIFNGSDSDWIAVNLVAGQTYTVNLSGINGGGGTMSDPVLRVMNSLGVQIHHDDDSGTGFDSRLNFVATTTGTHYLNAGGIGDSVGTYTFSIDDYLPPPVGTNSDLAAYLIDGYFDETGATKHTFGANITVELGGLTAEGKQLARWAMDAWEAVADVSFFEVASAGHIRFDDDSAVNSFTLRSSSGTLTTGADIYLASDLLSVYGTTIDSYSMQTYVREFGTALGLGDLGQYSHFSPTYGIDQLFANDSWQVSVMSPFSQYTNTTINANSAYAVTPMMVDVIAIQALYGAPDASSTTAGNTYYGYGTNLTGYLGTLNSALIGGEPASVYGGSGVAMTIYDHSGSDTINFSNSTTNDVIRLSYGTYSDVYGLVGNLAIAEGTWIENYISGTGNDIIFGNGINNLIWGLSGNDWLLGGNGNDKLYGGYGADNLRGDDGNDSLYGGSANDNLRGGSGDDWLLGGNADDVLYGDNGDDNLRGGDNNDLLYGGNGNDDVRGDEGDDWVQGDGGHDILHGGGGTDTMRGDDGNDTMNGDNGNDHMAGAAGEDFMSGGNGADRMYGGTGQDLMNGNDGNDTMYGQNDNDTMFGDAGNDTMFGGRGIDFVYGGDGDDLVVGEDGNDALFGNAGNDMLAGGAGVDFMYGSDGNDRVYGGTGNDILFGENGDDFMSGQNDHDWINGGIGNDTLHGDAGNDELYGGLGNDMLFGDAGNDSMVGEDGDDFMVGAEGADNLLGGMGADRLYGGVGVDILYGQDGDDFMDGQNDGDHMGGGAGNDTMYGGAGNDTMFGDSGLDWLLGDAGNDTILAGDDRDWLRGGDGDDTLLGQGGNDDVRGGNGNDAVFGGVGSDTLFGNNGNDRLKGFSGNDELTGGAGSDVFMFSDATEIDVIHDFQNGTDMIEIDATGIDTIANLTISYAGGNATVLYNTSRIVMEGVTTGQLDASDFTFL